METLRIRLNKMTPCNTYLTTVFDSNPLFFIHQNEEKKFSCTGDQSRESRVLSRFQKTFPTTFDYQEQAANLNLFSQLKYL